MTALHWAAERGDAAMTEMLVYAGANVEAVTRIGQYTPLHLAAAAGNAARRRRAGRRRAPTSSAKTTTSGATPLHLAAAAGNGGVVTPAARPGRRRRREGIGVGPDAADVRRRRERRRGDPRAASSAAPMRPSTTKTIDIAHQSALDRAAGNVQKKVLEASVAKGAAADAEPGAGGDRSVARSCYASGKIPPPEPAAAGGRGGRGGDDANAANSFNPEEINPPVSSKGGMTALLHAARQGHLEAARALLDGGAPINQSGSGDMTQPAADGGDQRRVRPGEDADRARRQREPRRRRQRRDAAVGRDQHAVAAADALPAAAGDGAAEDDLSRRDEGAAREGRGSGCAAHDASLVSRLQRLRQPQLRPRQHRRLDGVLARRVRHRRRGDEAAGRVRRRSEHPDDRAERAGAPRRRRSAGRAPAVRSAPTARRQPGEVQRAAGARRRPGRATRFTPRPASATAKASPATRIVTRRTRGWRR